MLELFLTPYYYLKTDEKKAFDIVYDSYNHYQIISSDVKKCDKYLSRKIFLF
jgi:hypothetical protein